MLVPPGKKPKIFYVIYTAEERASIKSYFSQHELMAVSRYFTKIIGRSIPEVAICLMLQERIFAET